MELKPHQQKIVDYMQTTDQRGIILYHTVGSGKTITSISISQLYNKKLHIIVPASIRSQWEIELSKMGVTNYFIKSYEGLLKLIKHNSSYLTDKVVIVDEAHRLRGKGKISKRISKGLQAAYKVILLTGTPIVNVIFDISPLINAATGKYTFPLKEKSFYKKFGNDPANNDKIKKIMDTYISYYKPDDNGYPSVSKHIIKVKMSKEQYTMYQKATSQIPTKELHMMQSGKTIKNSINFNSFLNATRQISNTFKGNTNTPKLNKILKYIQLEELPAIIYSTWLDNGVVAMSKILKENNITYSLFTGELNDQEKYTIVQKYNNKEIDVLLLSSSGGEGLDLKNTRQIHIMEPHWNSAKINQVIGRGVRYKSHENLPENEQHVKIFYWISIPYYKITSIDDLKIGTDEYLYMMSDKKTKEINKLLI
jgi:superfamily II DNA or RNA helicase